MDIPPKSGSIINPNPIFKVFLRAVGLCVLLLLGFITEKRLNVVTEWRYQNRVKSAACVDDSKPTEKDFMEALQSSVRRQN